MGNIGFKEILVILLVVLLIFGTKKLKSIGSDLGSAVRGFKKSMSEGESEEQANQASKQIGAPGKDAEFPDSAKSEHKNGAA